MLRPSAPQLVGKGEKNWNEGTVATEGPAAGAEENQRVQQSVEILRDAIALVYLKLGLI